MRTPDTLTPLALAAALAAALAGCGGPSGDPATRAEPAGETDPQSAYARLAEDFESVTTGLEIDIALYDAAGTEGLDITSTLAEDGTVTLRGEVDDRATAKAAIAAVHDLPAVSSVVDQLTVASSGEERTGLEETLGDRSLESRTRLAVLREIGTDGLEVRVSARQGTVELRGTVPSEEVRTRAVTAVETAEGVREVVDRIRVAHGG